MAATEIRTITVVTIIISTIYLHGFGRSKTVVHCKIFGFLHTFNVLNSYLIICMDAQIICNTGISDLKQMGLEALGDIVALATFASKLCSEEKSEPKNTKPKRQLLLALLSRSGPNRKSTCSEGGKAVKRQSDTITMFSKPLKVLTSWLNINEKKKHNPPPKKKRSYKSNKRGGGSGQMELQPSSNEDDVIKMGEKLVFPDGCSGYGSPDDMPFGIASYQQKDLNGVNLEGVQLPLTLQRYTEQSIEQSQTIRNNKER